MAVIEEVNARERSSFLKSLCYIRTEVKRDNGQAQRAKHGEAQYSFGGYVLDQRIYQGGARRAESVRTALSTQGFAPCLHR